MLIIRDEQIEVFQKAAVRNFENVMIEHIKDFAPGHAKSLGKEGVCHVVRLGIERAKTYGFDTGGPVRFYIEMMFMFGSYFDTDCQIPWAGKILTDPDIPNQAEKADVLYDKAMDYLDNAAGSNREFAVASLKRAAGQSFDELCDIKEKLVPTLIARFKLNSPEKCRYIGDRALHDLIRQGGDQAAEYGLGGPTGTIVFAGFMFMSGQGFSDDPLFPWVKEILTEEEITDPKEKLKRLHSKGMAYAAGALKHLESTER